jgi:hypothetical protein
LSAETVIKNLRIIPRDSDFLNRKTGSSGEVFYDQNNNTLRLFDGSTAGGTGLAKNDLTNVSNTDLIAKLQAAGVLGGGDTDGGDTGGGTGGGTATIFTGVSLGTTPPTSPASGTIWFNTENGRLYVYYNDGSGAQWVQPQTPTIGSGGGQGNVESITDLSDVSISNLTSGQVLKYNGTVWVNSEDSTGGGGGGGATTLDQLTDVVLSSPTTNQIIQYNGTTWVNTSLPTLVTSITAGTGISISASTGNITITNSVATPALSALPDAVLASLRVDRIAYQAITRLVVSNTGATAFNFSQYIGNNPSIYVINGTTIAFELTSAGHPFLIQDPLGNNYSTGLIHVATDGTTSTGASAQGKTSGTLYWQVSRGISGSYRYQSSTTGSLVGLIVIKDFAAI